MLSGNGTIDYEVEAHTLDALKTSAARQESTRRNLHPPLYPQRRWLLWRLQLLKLQWNSPPTTHTSLAATTITIEAASTTSVNGGSFTPIVNGESVEGQTLPWTTNFMFDATTLSLSFSSRQTAFVFTGEATTEVIILPEHTHVTVNGIETAVGLPALTTTPAVTDSTNVIVTLPEVTTASEFTAESYIFSVTIDTIDDTTSSLCGAFTLGENGSSGDTCLPSISAVITLPTAAGDLYLHTDGLTTSFLKPFFKLDISIIT